MVAITIVLIAVLTRNKTANYYQCPSVVLAKGTVRSNPFTPPDIVMPSVYSNSLLAMREYADKYGFQYRQPTHDIVNQRIHGRDTNGHSTQSWRASEIQFERGTTSHVGSKERGHNSIAHSPRYTVDDARILVQSGRSASFALQPMPVRTGMLVSGRRYSH